jgi:hypothetical protein
VSISVITIADVAQAAQQKLNNALAGTFSQTFTVERVWDPVFDMKAGDLDRLRVAIAANPVGRSVMARAGKSDREIRVEVAVYIRLPKDVLPSSATANTFIDPLVKFVQELVEYPRQAPGGFDCAGASFFKAESDAMFDRAVMREMRVFSAVVVYVFKLFN